MSATKSVQQIGHKKNISVGNMSGRQIGVHYCGMSLFKPTDMSPTCFWVGVGRCQPTKFFTRRFIFVANKSASVNSALNETSERCHNGTV